MSKSIERHTSISEYLNRLSTDFRSDFKDSSKALKKASDDFFIHRIDKKVGTAEVCVKPHRADFYRLIYIEKGKVKISIDGRSIDSNDNSVLLINPYQVTTFSAEDMQGYAVYFLPAFINRGFYERMEAQLPVLRFYSSVFIDISKKGSVFGFYLACILREFHRQDLGYKRFIESSLLALLILINRFHGLQTVTEGKRSKMINLLIEFESLILKYLPERKPLKHFAKKLSISKKHLNESVKKTTGKTTSQYINYLYMLEAERLLLQTDQSVLEISFLLGFKDASHFGKMFRSHFDVPPLTYRKQKFKILGPNV
jgi:AraC family transcriptional activator of pobA